MPRTADASILDAALTGETDRTTLMGSVTVRLRQLILDGDLPPGTALPPTQLAPRLGVSVMPVREALRILEAEGLVTFLPRRGARVAELTEEDIEEIYLQRAALEGLAARLSVQHQRPEDVARLREAMEAMEAAQARGDLPDLLRWDREFHRRQYDTSRRPGLVARILELWDAGRRSVALTLHSQDPMTWRTSSHRVILEACERGDAADAERLTRHHTDEASKRLREALREARRTIDAGATERDT